tara:strand:+ start:1646 stop:2725 length:1080 start_codon:yes stop_codon:yes gene_type:complete
MNIENPVYNPDIPKGLPYGGVGVSPTDDAPDIITPEDVRKEEKEDSQKKEDTREHKNAILSKAAYDYYNDGYDKAEAELTKYLPNHTILKELSGPNSIVIKKRNHITIAYRGTDWTNLNDLKSDVQIALGNNITDNLFALDRFRKADEKYLAVKSAYPDARITLTGHSLGATQGIHTGRKYDLEGTFFNAGSSPLSLPTELKESFRERKNHFTIHHVYGDPISASNYWLDESDKIIPHFVSPIEYAKQLFVQHKVANPHSLSNFYKEDYQLEWSKNSSKKPFSLGVYLPDRVLKDIDNNSFLKPKGRKEYPLSDKGVIRPVEFTENLGSFRSKNIKGCLPCPKGKKVCDCFKPKKIKGF